MMEEQRTQAIELLCEIRRILEKANESELRKVYLFIKPLDK